MLPAYLLEIFLRFKRSRLTNSLIVDQSHLAFCILPNEINSHSLEGKTKAELEQVVAKYSISN